MIRYPYLSADILVFSICFRYVHDDAGRSCGKVRFFVLWVTYAGTGRRSGLWWLQGAIFAFSMLLPVYVKA